MLRAQDWNIEHSKTPPISFFSVRSKTKGRKAYRVKAHGHLSHKEQGALYEYGKQTGTHVIYVHEVADREIEFIRIYPKNKAVTPDPHHPPYATKLGTDT